MQKYTKRAGRAGLRARSQKRGAPPSALRASSPAARGKEKREGASLESCRRYARQGIVRRRKFWNPSPATQGKGKRGDAILESFHPPLRRGQKARRRKFWNPSPA